MGRPASADDRPPRVTVAFQDQLALGATDGAEFDFFYGAPVLNEAGDVAFRASLRRGPLGDPVTADNDEGVFGPTSGPGSALGLIARENTVGPGVTDGAVHSRFRTPLLNDAGEVLFWSQLRTGAGGTVEASNNEALFGPVGAGGFPPATTTLGLIARTGSPAGGTVDDADFDSFGNFPTFGAGSGVATHASLRTGTGPPVTVLNNDALFGPAIGSRVPNFQPLFREDDPAPGVTDGAEFGQFLEATVNDQNDTTFKAFLRTGTGPPVLSGASVAIYGPSAGTGTPVGLIARSGDPAPGTTDGALYSPFGTPRVNNAGEVAFRSFLQTGPGGAPVTSANNSGLFATDRNNGYAVALRARAGDPAPGADALFGSLGRPGFNDAGDVAFASKLLSSPGGLPVSESNDWGLFGPTDGPGSPLGLLLREGDVVDDDGATLREFASGLQLNGAGDLAVLSSVAEPGTGRSRTALIGIHRGQASVIARIGDLLTVDLPGGGTAERTVLTLFFAPTDESDTNLNDTGDLAFHMIYSDGSSGIYTASVLTETLAGDYNGDGFVDAADYTVWRDGASPDSGQAGYDVWAGNYGATMPMTSSAVPEPTALVSLLLVGSAAMVRRRRG